MIRPATKDDIPALVALGLQMHHESRYRVFSFDEEKCTALAEQLIDVPFGVVLVAEHGGVIVGWMGGGIAEQWFSHDRLAFEYGVFISKEHRGGSAGCRLVKAFIQWAKDTGATEIRMGITTGVNEDRTGALYQKLGFARAGQLYSMGV
ncbi:GNAT family N-acetyltransferase [Dickeya sp. ws52]|uniref:GNAT family N-acetyltransferase n=1 Tax=Dickeya sp. ws52 TaxID=2576377 RepID=UPI00117D0EE1|nr:GNAT family N-acetyltransferase [Dickeya sp. ws52]TYL43910.1 GNAT family N-acetyltransferase [Dickeya sp. ws52]